MEYFYSCGCVASLPESPDSDYCTTHGRKWITKALNNTATPKVKQHSTYGNFNIHYCLATSLDIDYDDYDLVIFDSPSNILKTMPKVPFIVAGPLDKSIACLPKINMKKHVLTDAGLFYSLTEVDGSLHPIVQPYYLFNMDLYMSKVPYLGVTGLLYDYFIVKLNATRILHIGAKNIFLARMCKVRGFSYTCQTTHISVYNSLATERNLAALSVSEKGKFT